MSFFNDIKGKISKSSQDTVKKAKSIAGIAKLNSQIAEEQRALMTFYAQIGEKYYSLNKDAPAEEFAQFCDRITAGIMRVAELQAEIQRLKNTRLCPNCGAACPANVQYCSTCGGQFPQASQEQDDLNGEPPQANQEQDDSDGGPPQANQEQDGE